MSSQETGTCRYCTTTLPMDQLEPSLRPRLEYPGNLRCTGKDACEKRRAAKQGGKKEVKGNMEAVIHMGRPSPPPPDRISIYRYGRGSSPYTTGNVWSLTVAEAEELRELLGDVLMQYKERISAE